MRRHHNNTGYRQIKNGKTYEQVERIKKRIMTGKREELIALLKQAYSQYRVNQPFYKAFEQPEHIGLFEVQADALEAKYILIPRDGSKSQLRRLSRQIDPDRKTEE